MNRNEFLHSLRKHLSFLEKEELEREVLYYINQIDSSKSSDEEVIKSFGSMNSIIKKVCKKHKINYKNITKKENWFKKFYNELIDLSSVLKNSDGKTRMNILLDLLLLVIVTCVLKIPFIFIRDLGDRLTETLLNSNIAVLAMWGLLNEISYVILALTFFIKTFDKWFQNIK